MRVKCFFNLKKYISTVESLINYKIFFSAPTDMLERNVTNEKYQE
jgi:hypothetical protein